MQYYPTHITLGFSILIICQLRYHIAQWSLFQSLLTENHIDVLTYKQK